MGPDARKLTWLGDAGALGLPIIVAEGRRLSFSGYESVRSRDDLRACGWGNCSDCLRLVRNRAALTSARRPGDPATQGEPDATSRGIMSYRRRETAFCRTRKRQQPDPILYRRREGSPSPRRRNRLRPGRWWYHPHPGALIMAVSQRQHMIWARRRELVRTIELLILKGDTDDPSALDEADREALRVALRIALECDVVFRQIIRSKDAITFNDPVDHACDSIRAAIDSFATIKQTSRIFNGVRLPPVRPGRPLLQSLVRHGVALHRLQQPGLDLPARMSLLLELIRIELIFFGHVW